MLGGGSLGERIRRARRSSFLTQSAFAERVGVSVSAVRRWEADASVPSLKARARLAELLDADLFADVP